MIQTINKLLKAQEENDKQIKALEKEVLKEANDLMFTNIFDLIEGVNPRLAKIGNLTALNLSYGKENLGFAKNLLRFYSLAYNKINN